MAAITLRATVGRPLTNNEIDTNFTNLNNDVALRLLSADYTAADVLTKIKTVDGTNSGLDADLLDGHNSDVNATANTIVLRDNNGGIACNGFTGALSGNSSTATKLATGRSLSLTGDGTATLSSFDGSANVTATLTLATVNSTTGTFGSSTVIPVITVNGKGLVTSITTQSLSAAITLNSGSGSGSVSLGGILNIGGGTGITTAVSGAVYTVAIDSNVVATKTYVQTAGQNSQGLKTVQSILLGVPLNTTGSNGDIIYQY